MLVLYFGVLFKNLSGGTEEYYGIAINIYCFSCKLGSRKLAEKEQHSSVTFGTLMSNY